MTNSKRTKFLGELGEISRELLILIGVIIVIIIIITVVISMATKPEPLPEESEEEEYGQISEVELGDVRIKLEGARDRGNTLKASEKKSGREGKDLVTTERFIEVTISAENIGKDNISAGYWQIKNLVDSEGRIFYFFPGAELWILGESKCGALLKPGFSPTFCTKIYEVAKISTGLKVEVSAKRGKSEFIDLGI